MAAGCAGAAGAAAAGACGAGACAGAAALPAGAAPAGLATTAGAGSACCHAAKPWAKPCVLTFILMGLPLAAVNSSAVVLVAAISLVNVSLTAMAPVHACGRHARIGPLTAVPPIGVIVTPAGITTFGGKVTAMTEVPFCARAIVICMTRRRVC